MLFEPFKIGKMELKNRLVMAPLSCNMSEDGFIKEQMVKFYEERAKGGVGLITIGDGIVETPLGNNVKDNVAIDDDKYIFCLSNLSRAVKVHGAKIALQLSHGGRRAGRVSKDGYLRVTRGMIPVAPSAIPHPVPGQVVPRELTLEEIYEIIEKFGESTKRAILAGFDAIGLHCAHMYLCGQFISPWANKRNDEFGGDLERRVKFVVEIIKRIKRETGDDYPLIVRMNGQEPDGGNTLDEIRKIAGIFEEAGADAIHVSVGFAAAVKDPDFIPASAPMRAPNGCIVHLAENIKKGVKVPVIAVNRIGSYQLAEDILKEKKADMIAMGRPLIAEPNLPIYAAEGAQDKICPCIFCCGCVQEVAERESHVACAVNPMAGRELEGPVMKAQKSKKVLVLGAGPAGMQAALTATMRGHQVTLIEKDQKMGGELIYGCKPPGKKDIELYLKYITDRINNSEIEVKLGKEINRETIDKIKPDVAIIATGAKPIAFNIEGLNKKKSYTVREILSGAEVKENNITIIGGGTVGCELAEMLCEQGKKVTIIEVLEDIAMEMDHLNRLPLIISLEQYKVRVLTKTRVESISEEGVWVNFADKKELIKTDSIVIAVGKKASFEKIDEILEKKVPEVYKIGDKIKPRRIMDAVREGYDIGRRI